MTTVPDAVPEPSFESEPMIELDAMGREKFWEDIGRKDD
jgi:hypothetical protein